MTYSPAEEILKPATFEAEGAGAPPAAAPPQPLALRSWLALLVVLSGMTALMGLSVAGYGLLMMQTPWPVELEPSGDVDAWMIAWGGCGILLAAGVVLVLAARAFRRVDEACVDL